MVDRDTGFIDCFAHVLGSQSRSRSHEYDLLAILVGNATNQGIYGMAQILIVPMISSALSGELFARKH
ncbi:Putative transposase (identified by ISEscan HMM) [Klebsiella pneumoniae]|nr:Tn3 family transposase [Klebsiella pneumoniae]VDA49743.1 Putative transposase (identified by ISEscan HMM) [Klebsiella pneumoniae]